jgi:hypothetical protein
VYIHNLHEILSKMVYLHVQFGARMKNTIFDFGLEVGGWRRWTVNLNCTLILYINEALSCQQRVHWFVGWVMCLSHRGPVFNSYLLLFFKNPLFILVLFSFICFFIYIYIYITKNTIYFLKLILCSFLY